MKNKTLLISSILILVIGQIACNDEKEYLTSNLFKFEIESNSIVYADSTKMVKLICTLIEKNTDKREITFTASSGTFSDSVLSNKIKVKFNGNDTAMVWWTSTKNPGLVTFSANFENLDEYKVEKEISLTPSYPDSILLTSNLLAVDSTSTITIMAYFAKQSGKTSSNLPFKFTAIQYTADGISNAGNFTTNAYSTTTGENTISSTFVPADGDFDISKPIIIKSYFPNNLLVKSDSLVIKFK